MDSLARPAALKLLAAALALLAYMSFYPFQFDLMRFQSALEGPLTGLVPWKSTSQVDIIVNLLGYIPVGFFAALALPSQWSMPRRILTAILTGALFSAGIEVAQNATRGRHPNLIDAIMNTISSGAGAILGVWARRRAARGSAALWLPHLEPVPLLLLLLWTALHAAPFIPSLGLYKLHAALEPVRSMAFRVEDASRAFAAWLIFASVIKSAARPGRFWHALAAGGILSLLCRVAFQGRLTFDELAGMSVAIVWTLFRPRHAFALVLAVLLISGLSPFHILPPPEANPFSWVPFAGFLEGDREAWLLAIEKTFLYLGAVWLAAESGLSPAMGGCLVAPVLAAVEWAQTRLPGRTPEVTDPVIALLAAAIVALVRARSATRIQP